MQIEISVRGFVEFLLRSGDIDNRRTGGAEDAMLEGARLHRKLQSRAGIEYSAEVKISRVIECEGYDILIEGRADGIIKRPNTDLVVIDEIKTTYRDINKMVRPEEVHLAQAKVYAYFYCLNEGVDEIGVRMTYCNINTEEIRYFHENYKKSELKKWFDGLLTMYKKWSDFEYEWHFKRNESIDKLVFPFTYRPGQKELVGYVYKTITEGKKLYLEAPTGVGKTISVLYPSLKCVSEGRIEKLFYLTAKTITGSVARETLDLLRKQDMKLKSVSLTAKEKMCPLDECVCNPTACPYAKGHFDRINDAVYDLLTHEDAFDRDMISEYALEHEVCPFEMQLDMTNFSDAIICDYNYLFDPYVRLKRYFAEGAKGNYMFMVDEAHNLVERGRDMYSAVLYKEDFLKLKGLMKEYSGKIANAADKCNRVLLKYKKELPPDSEYMILPEEKSELILNINKLYGEISAYLDDHEKSPVREELLEYYFNLARYLDTYDRSDVDHYMTYVSYDGRVTDGDGFMIKIFCIDPGAELKRCMEQGVASVLFSATFLPIQYYKKLLGGTPDDYEAYAKSVFDDEKRLVMVGNQVTSKYTRRGPAEYRNIASYIHEITSVKKGKYMVFLPSHAFLKEVSECYIDEYGDESGVDIVIQENIMRERDREKFLNIFLNTEDVDFEDIGIDVEISDEDMYDISFKSFASDHVENDENEENGSKTIIGFCVMGGIFSEGIDLKNDALIGVIIVGTGLPQVGNERDIIKRHFDNAGENGFDYAYRFPGMNKVLQAAGRVIRTSEDTGVIALLDERFGQLNYKRLFPREWKNIKTVSIADAGVITEEFWEIHTEN